MPLKVVKKTPVKLNATTKAQLKLKVTESEVGVWSFDVRFCRVKECFSCW